jgi:hypothetical protein
MVSAQHAGGSGVVRTALTPVDPSGTDDIVRLPAPALGWRAVLVAALAALFVTGTVIGDDPWWPFGPWRMFSTSTAPTGAVIYLSIEIRSAGDPAAANRAGPAAGTDSDVVGPGTDSDVVGPATGPDDEGWRPAPILLESVGLNRAEVEGRVPQITAHPSMLATLAVSHARLRPHEPRWTGVRVVRNEAVIINRRPTGEVRRVVLASWTAP